MVGSSSEVAVEIEVDEWEWDKLLVSNATALEIQREEKFITTDSRRVVYRSAEDDCFCCQVCCSPPPPPCYDSSCDLVMLWNRIRFSKIPNTECPATVRSNSEYSESPSPFSKGNTTISFEPPINEPASAFCSECKASLISAKAFVSPPGFCEYSGKLICGDCFEPRQMVVPWKLLVSKAHRGNVSRESARSIRSKYYSIEINVNRLHSETLNHVHSLREEYVSKRKGMRCVELEKQLELASSPLPLHIRNEEASFPNNKNLYYSLADLIDILAPVNKESLILSSLKRSVRILNSHSCSFCKDLFWKICDICLKPLHIADRNRFVPCAPCGSFFHSRCFQLSTDGCPVCPNLLARDTSETSFDQHEVIQLVI